MDIHPIKTLNIIKIEGPINENTFMSFKNSLIALRRPGYQLNIDTRGGQIIATLKIIELINHSGSPKCLKTFGEDMVASAGLELFMYGEYRYCKPTTKFLIHRFYHEETRKIADKISETEYLFFKHISEKSKLSLDEVINLACAKNGNGTIFKAYQALEWGIVHKCN